MAERTCSIEGCDHLVSGQGRTVCDGCRTIEHQCETCGVLFRRLRKKRPRFCSIGCRPGRQRIDKIAMACEHCGSSYFRYPSQIKIGRGKFCSRRCAGLGRPINGRPSRIASDAIDVFLTRCPALVEAEKRIGRWSVDLAIPLHQVAVELDGSYWHSLPAMADRDRRKDAWLAAHSWTVVRIPIEARDTAETVADRIEEGVAPWIKRPSRRRGRTT